MQSADHGAIGTFLQSVSESLPEHRMDILNPSPFFVESLCLCLLCIVSVRCSKDNEHSLLAVAVRCGDQQSVRTLMVALATFLECVGAWHSRDSANEQHGATILNSASIYAETKGEEKEDEFGWSLLSLAVHSGDELAVRILMETGLDTVDEQVCIPCFCRMTNCRETVRNKQRKYWTALMVAVKERNESMIRILLNSDHITKDYVKRQDPEVCSVPIVPVLCP